METNFNLGALKIVYSPLMEYFETIQTKVNENLLLIENQRSNIDYDFLPILTKVQSLLKMIGLSGVVKVLNLVQDSFKEENSNFLSNDKKLELWQLNENVLKNIKDYLKQIYDGALDQPIKLYSQYEKVGNLINKEIDIKDLFSPKLDVINKDLRKSLRVGLFLNKENKEILINNIEQTKNLINTNISTIIKNIDILDSKSVEFNKQYSLCKQVYDLLMELQNQKISKSYYVLFGIQKVLICLANPITNEEYASLSQDRKSELIFNLNLISETLVNLIKELNKLNSGDKTGSLKPSDDIVKENLFFLINMIKENKILKTTSVFKDLESIFDYNFYANQFKNVDFKSNYFQQNPENTHLIDKLILEIKEELTLLTSKVYSENVFEQYISKFEDLLNKLNENIEDNQLKLKEFLFVLENIVDKIRKKEISFNDIIQREISLSVVLLEYALNFFIKYNTSSEEKVDFEKQLNLELSRLQYCIEGKDINSLELPTLDIKNKEIEERKVLLKIYEEIAKEIKISEDILDNILREEDFEEKDLGLVFKSLISVRGALSVVGYKELSTIVKEISEIWHSVLKEGLEKSNRVSLNKSINWLSGISLFTQAAINNNMIEADDIEDKLINDFKLYNKEDTFAHIKAIDVESILTNSKDIKSTNNIDEISDIDSESSSVSKEKDNIVIIDNMLKDLEQLDTIESFDTELIDNNIKHDMSVREDTTEKKLEAIGIEGSEDSLAIVAAENLLPEGFVRDSANDEELLDVYLEEMEVVEIDLANSLSLLRNNLQDKEALIGLRRSYHTLKGSGRMVGLTNLGEIAWLVEDELTRTINLEKEVSMSMIDAIQDMNEKFKSWKEELAKSREVFVSLEVEKEEFLNKYNKVEVLMNKEDSVSSESDLISDKLIDENILVSHDKPQVVEVVDVLQNNQTQSDIEENSTLIEGDIPTISVDEKSTIDVKEDSNDTIIEDSNDTIIEEIKDPLVVINGVEMNKSLYDLFNDESNEHLEELRAFVHNENNMKNVRITYDFMRNAHTLASIARTVNLIKLATLSLKIENISNLAMEKNKVLSRAEMTVLRHAVDNLDLFKSDSMNNLDESHYDDISQNLEDLYNALNQEDVKSENNMGSSNINENEIKDFLSKLSESIQKDVQQTLSSFKENTKEIDIDTLSNKILEKVEISLAKNKSLEVSSNHNENMLNKLEELEKKFEAVVNKQSSMEKTHKDGLISIKKDLQNLATVVKKKSSGFGEENVGNEDYINNKEVKSVDIIENNLLDNIPSNPVKQIITSDNIVKDSIQYELFEQNPYLQSIFIDKISTVIDEIDDEIYEIARGEVDEFFLQVENILENIHTDKFDIEKTNELKRILHTFKGSVRMAGANKMGLIAHRLESLLEYAENHNISLFKIKPLLEKEIEKLSYLNNNLNASLSPEKLIWLDSILDVVEQNEIVIDEPLAKAVSVKDDKHYIRITSELLDYLINSSGELRLSRTTLEGTLDVFKRIIMDLKTASIKLNRIGKEIELQAETQISSRQEQLNEIGKNFDPLELDRYTRVQELARFMSEGLEDIKDLSINIDDISRTQETAIVQQALLTNHILDSLMNVRLVSVDSISPKLFKLVGKTAKEMEKRVTLEISGENTEVDRLVLDRIQSPIEHLLRNCIAHGIESPAIRELAGKSEKGLINLSVNLEGNFIILKLSDDGQGINIEKVKKLGVEKGLISSDKEYSEEDIVNLIFTPGFSTATTISQVSGRGVGMDVVKNEIFTLGGSIKINTKQGVGTEFTITLPVSVATNQATLVKVSNKLVAIPAILINQVFSSKKKQLEKSYESGSITYKDKEYPLYYLGHLLGTLSPKVYPELKTYNTLILISYLDKELVLHIDQLETTDEILIKSIGEYLGKVSGLLGATLLGDGRQGIVINPILLQEHFTKNIMTRYNNVETLEIQDKKHKESNVIMVVDDSITVRRATMKILEKYGYSVVVAKDGEDALEQLQVVTPDVILSDIEMPVMDGFEFLKNVRNTEKYKNIPVIMITSRTADKHRNMAYDLGVNGFLGKPYQEDELINQIKNLVNK